MMVSAQIVGTSSAAVDLSSQMQILSERVCISKILVPFSHLGLLQEACWLFDPQSKSKGIEKSFMMAD